MTRFRMVVVLLVAGALAHAQGIPPGTALPVMLSSTLDSAKSKPGQQINARIMQDVPLSSGGHISAGSRVIGRVVEVDHNGPTPRPELAIKFERLRTKQQDIPLTVSLRAIASMLDVRDAQLPEHGPFRGDNPYNWTTVQIGDDVVYRGGGPVMHAGEVVGVPVYGGVLAEIRSSPGSECPPDETHRKQALWVFSSDVCGAYGFDDLVVKHGGWTAPLGLIRLQSSKRVRVSSGSGLLLMVLDEQH